MTPEDRAALVRQAQASLDQAVEAILLALREGGLPAAHTDDMLWSLGECRRVRRYLDKFAVATPTLVSTSGVQVLAQWGPGEEPPKGDAS